MPFHLKLSESIPGNIVRILHEETASATGALKQTDPKHRDVGIHEARKSIKKIRGVLKLMRYELGKKSYRGENTSFGNIGRKLGDLRDAGAIIQTFDALLQQYPKEAKPNDFRPLRNILTQDKQAKEAALDVVSTMQGAGEALSGLQQNFANWPLKTDGFAALETGLRQTFKQGRKALRIAEASDDPADLHEFRKRAKDHWYQVRLLEKVWNKEFEIREGEVHRLESTIGDHHNLVVLSELFQSGSTAKDHRDLVQTFLSLAAREQAKLRDTALSLGKQLYEDKSATFVAHVQQLWDLASSKREKQRGTARTQRKLPTRSGRKKRAA
jgi:CHAD domain-containing protein